MLGAGRLGSDSAGGPIISGAHTVIINGAPAARLGSAVAGHGKDEHSSPRMVGGAPDIIVEGLPLCRMGDPASCGHRLVPGSPDVMAG